MIAQKYFSLSGGGDGVSMFTFLSFAVNAVLFYAAWTGFSLRNKLKPSFMSKSLYVCGALSSVSVLVISLLITALAETVSSSVLFTVSSAVAIIVTSAVGRLCFKERITIKSTLGIVLCITAVALLNFSQTAV